MHASCQMIEGHSICVCNSGYEGDGVICTPTGECVADSNCGPNEMCMYNETSFIYSCKCLEGYQKLENKCQRSRKTQFYILLTINNGNIRLLINLRLFIRMPQICQLCTRRKK